MPVLSPSSGFVGRGMNKPLTEPSQSTRGHWPQIPIKPAECYRAQDGVKVLGAPDALLRRRWGHRRCVASS